MATLPDLLGPIMLHLLDCAEQSMIEANTPVGRAHLVAGLDAVWDDCCESDEDTPGGTLWVRVIEQYPTAGQSSPYPQRDTSPRSCHPFMYSVQLAVGVVRCTPTVDDNGVAPSPTAISLSALEMTRDRANLEAAIRCCFADPETLPMGMEEGKVILFGWNPVGANGGCAGGEWTLYLAMGSCKCGTPLTPEPPTAPTALVASAITDTSFSLSWTASVTTASIANYEVYVNGVLVAQPLVPPYVVSGLTADTDYVVQVRARDSFGQFSPMSIPLIVTTDAAPASPQHTLFGVTEYGGRPVNFGNDGEAPGITVATAFLRTTPATDGWRNIGMRLWLPASLNPLTFPDTVSMVAYTPGMANPDLTGLPVRLEEVAIPGVGQWVDVDWEEPITVAQGEPVYLGYRFGTTGIYLWTPSPGAGRTQALDGSSLWEAGTAEAGFSRSVFRQGVTPTGTSNLGYSIDAKWDEGP